MQGFELGPKLFTAMKSYLKADLMRLIMWNLDCSFALAIAFGIALESVPKRNYQFVIVAGLSSHFLAGGTVGGPTGAFIVIIYGIIRRQDPWLMSYFNGWCITYFTRSF